MVGTASYRSGDPIKTALLGERYIGSSEEKSQVNRLATWVASGFADEGSIGSYARYWHGYQVLLAPLLCFLSISQIRQVLLVTLCALALALALLAARRCGPFVAVPLVLPLACFNMSVVCMTLSFAPAFLVGLAGAVAVMLCDGFAAQKMHGGGGRSPLPCWVTFFFVLGAVCVYVDFLDTPIVSLGLPLAALFARRFAEGEQSVREALVLALLLSAAWALGYFGLWATKWLVATLATGQDVIAQAIAQASLRSGTSGGEVSAQLSRIDVLLVNVSNAFPRWSIKVGMGVFGCVAVFAVIRAWCGWRPSREALVLIAGCAIVALLPVAWILVFAQHSYVHSWFVYRDLVLTLVGMALACAGLLSNDAHGCDVTKLADGRHNGRHIGRLSWRLPH